MEENTSRRGGRGGGRLVLPPLPPRSTAHGGNGGNGSGGRGGGGRSVLPPLPLRSTAHGGNGGNGGRGGNGSGGSSVAHGGRGGRGGGGQAPVVMEETETELKSIIRKLKELDPEWLDQLNSEELEIIGLFMDPITHEVMSDPVTIPQSGHTLDRQSLQNINKTSSLKRCPITRINFTQPSTLDSSMPSSVLIKSLLTTFLQKIYKRLKPTVSRNLQK